MIPFYVYPFYSIPSPIIDPNRIGPKPCYAPKLLIHVDPTSICFWDKESITIIHFNLKKIDITLTRAGIFLNLATCSMQSWSFF